MDRPLIKKIVTFIVGTCTSFTVMRLVRTYTPSKNRFERICIWIAAFTMGGLVARRAELRTEGQIDEFYEGIDSSRAARK